MKRAIARRSGTIGTRKAAFMALFLALGTGIVSPAHGQIASGQSGSSSLTYIDQAEAMITLTFFGRCYAKKNRNDALSLMATRPGSREEVQTFKKLFRGNIACMASDTNLRMPLPYVRGVIAEGLLRAGTSAPPAHVPSASVGGKANILSDAVGCYVPNHKREVQGLLATKPASKKEFEAVSAIMGDFAKCIPADRPLDLDATWVRFRLIEAMLRLQPTTAVVSER